MNELTRDEAMGYLTRDSGRVPCSRYGHDSKSCAPIAYAVCEIIADSNGEPITTDDLDHAMGLVVNDHDDVASLIREHGTADHRALDDWSVCEVCGDTGHYEDAHGEPLVIRDHGRDTVTGFVSTVLDDARHLALCDPAHPENTGPIGPYRAVVDLQAAWEAHTDDQRDEYASEYLDDIDAILSDAGYFPITNSDQGAWLVYGPVGVEA